MRENRTYGSEGGEPSNGSLPYPYRAALDYGGVGYSRRGWIPGPLPRNDKVGVSLEFKPAEPALAAAEDVWPAWTLHENIP